MFVRGATGSKTKACTLASSVSPVLTTDLTDEDLKMESSLGQQVCWTPTVGKAFRILWHSTLGSIVEKADYRRDSLSSNNLIVQKVRRPLGLPHLTSGMYLIPGPLNLASERDWTLLASLSLGDHRLFLTVSPHNQTLP